MFQSRPEKSVDWNRGAYLVQGLGHCGACHSPRSVLGGVQSAPVHPQSLAGGVMPVQNWYAPSLRSASEAGLQSMSVDEATVLLKHGRNQQASVIGPMADVVFQSTQYLSDTDLVAMVAYLKDLPAAEATSKGTLAPNSALSNVADRTERLDRASQQPGQKLYEMHCADCHGEAGQGAQAEGVLAYPRLAGNRAVTMSSPLNLVRIVVQGGFPPATAGNPKPYGMPPFSHTLNDSQIAEVLTYIRQAWGNDAAAVYSLDVVRSR